MKKPTATWRRENDALVVDVPYEANATWEQWVFLRADSHHDSIHCNQNLERRHLEEAKRKNALILDGGDLFLFDAMQGPGDKRSSKRELREEYKTDKYFDALVDHAARFYGHYSANWVLMGLGNHETAVIKYHNTDLTERLCERLRHEFKSPVMKGSYENYVRFDFRGNATKRTKVLYHHHGYGGGARVTKGVIDFQRIFVEIPTADFLFMGHIHNENIFTVPCEELTVENNRRKRKRYGIRVAGYKDEHGKGGWHDERGHGVRPLGGAWIRFFWDRVESRITEEVFTTSA